MAADEKPLTFDVLADVLDTITRNALRETLGDRLIESAAVPAGGAFVMLDLAPGEAPPAYPPEWEGMSKSDRGAWMIKNAGAKLVISTEGRYSG